MENNFCRRCGFELRKINNHTFECENKHTSYNNPAPTVGIFILEGNKVTMTVRGIDPGKGMLDTFGGFLDGNESFEEALKRELKEEAQLNPEDYETPEYFCSASATYSYEGETKPITSVFFTTKLKPGSKIIPSDDVNAIKIVNIKDVDLNLVFNDDIKFAYMKLGQKFGVII